MVALLVAGLFGTNIANAAATKKSCPMSQAPEEQRNGTTTKQGGKRPGGEWGLVGQTRTRIASWELGRGETARRPREGREETISERSGHDRGRTIEKVDGRERAGMRANESETERRCEQSRTCTVERRSEHVPLDARERSASAGRVGQRQAQNPATRVRVRIFTTSLGCELQPRRNKTQGSMPSAACWFPVASPHAPAAHTHTPARDPAVSVARPRRVPRPRASSRRPVTHTVRVRRPRRPVTHTHRPAQQPCILTACHMPRRGEATVPPSPSHDQALNPFWGTALAAEYKSMALPSPTQIREYWHSVVSRALPA
jgi:hypothetical protein